ESNIMILGFGFSGSGQNSAMAFTTLKDWRQRKGTTAQEEADHIRSQMANVPDAVTMSLLPPAISDMGTSSGFTYYLQDRGGKGYQALKKAADELIVQANHNPRLADVYIDGLGEGTSLSL
ncbi:efflux RND transporter permease subunit, partial [Klebsiella pneumoniae]|uniref:efflux RND transporter permease subunit n=1 Tax=Klebsiella pneumoniae TaxID=573 RepID=UPI003B5BFCF6